MLNLKIKENVIPPPPSPELPPQESQPFLTSISITLCNDMECLKRILVMKD